MNSRFAHKLILPSILLAVAFTVALWSGRASDTGSGTSEANFSSAQRAASTAPDTSQWATASRTLGEVHISYSYPPGWNADLVYCALGADTAQRSGHLPPGCASTDFLVAEKARDVGRIEGTPLTVSGMSATRLVVSDPANVLTSLLYTVMVYDNSGVPLFGINTQVGYDTDPATLQAITNTLDEIVSTLRVEAIR